MSSSPRTKRLGIIAFTILLVMLPFGMYYIFWVQSQKSYFTRRNFSALSDVGEQVKSKVDNLGTSLINAAKKVKQEPAKSTVPERKPIKVTAKDRKPAQKQAAPRDQLASAIKLIDQSGTIVKYDAANAAPQQMAVQQAPYQRSIRRGNVPSTNADALSTDTSRATVSIPPPGASARAAPPPPVRQPTSSNSERDLRLDDQLSVCINRRTGCAAKALRYVPKGQTRSTLLGFIRVLLRN